MNEAWRPVCGYPDYEVSDHGRCRRSTDGVNTFAGRILSPANVRGYRCVTLVGPNGPKMVKLHRLVCAAFNGAPPSDEHQAAHADGDRANNVPSNLRWATCKENHADRRMHGTDAVGSRNGRALLSEDQAAFVRSQPKRRGVCLDLAKQFGVSLGTINAVRCGETWRHVA